MILRLRLFEEVGDQKASTYWWVRDLVIGSDRPPFEQLEERAKDLAVALAPVHAWDHRYTGWAGQAWSDDALTRLTGWFKSDFPSGPFAGAVPGFSGPREVCVRLEYSALDQKRRLLTYHPFVPETFFAGAVELDIVGRVAWTAVKEVLDFYRVYVTYKPHVVTIGSTDVSGELTTLNSRRRRLTWREPDPLTP